MSWRAEARAHVRDAIASLSDANLDEAVVELVCAKLVATVVIDEQHKVLARAVRTGLMTSKDAEGFEARALYALYVALLSVATETHRDAFVAHIRTLEARLAKAAPLRARRAGRQN